MNPLKFSAMLLLQRSDEALRLERLRPNPNASLVTLLQRQKQRLRSRLRRSPGAHSLTGG